jgi:hypothetical protein
VEANSCPSWRTQVILAIIVIIIIIV